MINWKVRYTELVERYPNLLDADRCILEVGCGTEGLGRYLKRVVVGVDRVFDGVVNRHLLPARGSVLNLPFSDGAFDDVLCVDTLEHLPQGERPRAIRELIRVARRRVIIAGPAGAFAQLGDAAYARHLDRGGDVVPVWLEEHLRFGIPTVAEMLELLLAWSHPFVVHVNEGIIQHYSGLLADGYPFMKDFTKVQHEKFPLQPPWRRAYGEVPYSYQFAIDTTSTRPTAAAWPEFSSTSVGPAHATPRAPPAEIFAVGHRLDRMPEIPGIRRILAGASAPGPDAESGILRDDVGDTIARRNVDLSEMTAIYWVWKNVADLDGVGFCHYRRYFDFRNGQTHSARQTDLRSAEEVRCHQSQFMDRSVVVETLRNGAIIVARNLKPGLSIAEQYMRAHIADHYLTMVNYVLERHPYLAPHVVAQFRDTGFYANNMFVMRWADFDGLCQFWFDCLFRLDERIGKKPAGYQGRALAFLSERLLDIYVRWLSASGRRVVEYPVFFLERSAFASGD